MYDVGKVSKIVMDLEDSGQTEAEIRLKLTQAGLPDKILNEAILKAAERQRTPVRAQAPVAKSVQVVARSQPAPPATTPGALPAPQPAKVAPITPKPIAPVQAAPRTTGMEGQIADLKAQVNALQEILKQVLETNRSILLALQKR